MLKTIRILIIVLAIAIISSSCNSSNNKSQQELNNLTEIEFFEFPLQEDDIESVISNLNLDFSLTSISSDKDQLMAKISQENPYFTNLTIGGVVNPDPNLRRLDAVWRYEDKNEEILMKHQVAEIKKIIQLICNLYGNIEILDNLYGFIDSYKESEYNYSFMWATRVNDVHAYISIRNHPDEWTVLGFIRILNDKAYKYNYTAYINNMKTNELFNAQIVNIEQLKNSTDARFIVNGYLTNVNKIESAPEKFTDGTYFQNFNLNTSLDVNIYGNYEDYQTATFNDDFGSVDVYIEPNSFTEEELSEVRDYKIIKYSDGQDSFFIIKDIYN